jgi:hypothetical protein
MIGGRVREFVPVDSAFLRESSAEQDPTGAIAQGVLAISEFGLTCDGPDGKPTMAALGVQTASVMLFSGARKRRGSKRDEFALSVFLDAVGREATRRGSTLMGVFLPVHDKRTVRKLERLGFLPATCWLKSALPPVKEQKSM